MRLFILCIFIPISVLLLFFCWFKMYQVFLFSLVDCIVNNCYGSIIVLKIVISFTTNIIILVKMKFPGTDEVFTGHYIVLSTVNESQCKYHKQNKEDLFCPISCFSSFYFIYLSHSEQIVDVLDDLWQSNITRIVQTCRTRIYYVFFFIIIVAFWYYL